MMKWLGSFSIVDEEAVEISGAGVGVGRYVYDVDLDKIESPG